MKLLQLALVTSCVAAFSWVGVAWTRAREAPPDPVRLAMLAQVFRSRYLAPSAFFSATLDDPDESDNLVDLANAVRAARATNQELRALLTRFSPGHADRASVLLALAWTDVLGPEDEDLLVAEMANVFAGSPPCDLDRVAAGLAAVHALRLRDATAPLQRAFDASLARIGGLAGLSTSTSPDVVCVRVCAIALRSHADPRTRDVLAQLRGAQRECRSASRSAWMHFGCTASAQELESALEHVRVSPGPSRHVLEVLRDPKYVPELESFAAPDRELVSGTEEQARAVCALRGLVAIGTDAALDAFARCGKAHRSVALEALREFDDACRIGALLRLERRFPAEYRVREEFEALLSRLTADLALTHASHPDRVAACTDLEAALVRVREDPRAFEETLAVWLDVALQGDGARIRAAIGEREISEDAARRLELLR